MRYSRSQENAAGNVSEAVTSCAKFFCLQATMFFFFSFIVLFFVLGLFCFGFCFQIGGPEDHMPRNTWYTV